MTSSTRRGAGRGGATTFSSSSKKTDNNGLPENLLFDFRGPRFDDENPELTGPNLRVRSDRTIQFKGKSVGCRTALDVKGVQVADSGISVWAATINHPGENRQICIGVTCDATIIVADEGEEEPIECVPGRNLHGVSLNLSTGKIEHNFSGNTEMEEYFSKDVAAAAQDVKVIVIRTAEGACELRFCAGSFIGRAIPFSIPAEAEAIYPSVSLRERGSQVTFVESEQLGEHLNPVIYGLAVEWEKQKQENKEFKTRARAGLGLYPEAVEGDFLEAAKTKLRQNVATALTTGPAGCGKSSLFNALFCLCNEEELDSTPRSANRASTHGGGQWSTTYVRERCSMYFRNGKWNRKTDGDIVFIDGIGFTGIKDELRAAALGLLRDREAFDREDGNNKNSELFTREVNPKRRVSCIINCISAKQVVDKNPDIDRSVKAILQFAKELFADNNNKSNSV